MSKEHRIEYPCRLIAFVVSLSALFFLPAAVFAASLQFSPPSASYSNGQTFNVRVEASPDGDSINAVEATVLFDASKLAVQAVSKTGSAFSLWTTEPAFSNANGTIDFGGGSPTPFSNTSMLVTITFKAIAPGSAEVSFKDGGSVLAADGRGTNVLKTTKKGVYTVTAAEAPESTPAPTVGGNRPPAPVVESPSHPEEDEWYANNTAELKWKIPSGVTGVRLLMGKKPDSTPTVAYEPPIDTRIVDSIEDGVWYFHVQFENSAGWGDITHRTIRVDTTPPNPFDIVIIPAPEDASTTPPSVSFAATDDTSGIKEYTIEVEGKEPVTMTPDDLDTLPDKAYPMPRLYDGTYLVTVTAADFAGNTTESNVSVNLATGYVKETPSSAPAPVAPEQTGINWELFLIVFLLLVIVAMVTLFAIQRHRLIKEQDYLRKETRELRERMEKIFNVLQDELQEQIANLDGKPRLSASEKRILADLREALEVSEALINKEIEDVEKIFQ